MRSSRNQLQGNSPTLAIFSKLEKNVTKIEKTGIHFKTDVFAAVAVVDAKAPLAHSAFGLMAIDSELIRAREIIVQYFY